MINKITAIQRITGIIVLIAVIGFAISLTGCFSNWQGGDEGVISINLGGGSARDVMPWPTDDPDILSNIDFVITLTGPGNTQTLNAKNEGNIRASVSAGQWQVKVVAYMQGVETPLTPKGDRMPYATGISSVDVRTGQTSNVSIPMTADFCRICDFTNPTLATCTEPSKITAICSIDSSHNREIIITQALEHAYGAWDTTATCTAAGMETRTCTRNCGETGNTETRSVDALGHDHFESLVCKRIGCDHQYAMGDTGPAGGIIFYVADGIDGRTPINVAPSPDGTLPGWQAYTAYYLEVARTSEGTARWGGADEVPNITTFALSNDPEASYMGNGRKDTWLIVNFHVTDVTETAAQLCVNRTAGANDWFLPSFGELNQLYLNRAAVNAADGDLGTGPFWSSSQNAQTTMAWSKDLDNGGNFFTGKTLLRNVRAIRAF